MKLFAPFAALLLSLSPATAAIADTTAVYCRVSQHDHTIKPKPFAPCIFTQRQGHVYITQSDGSRFYFHANAPGRYASHEGISFTVEGEYTLNVLWASPDGPYPNY